METLSVNCQRPPDSGGILTITATRFWLRKNKGVHEQNSVLHWSNDKTFLVVGCCYKAFPNDYILVRYHT